MSSNPVEIVNTSTELIGMAGGYLRNTLHIPDVTCAVCAGPVDGYKRCFKCNEARSTAGIADLVTSMVYGVKSQQSGNLLRHYKDDPMPQVRERMQAIISRILFLGITLHEACIGRVVGQPVSMRVTVPSLRNRCGTHPFADLAAAISAVDPFAELQAVNHVGDDRPIDAGLFRPNYAAAFRGHHVLVLDDTWVTGSRAQSAALAVRAGGATKVSIMTIGRWLRPTHHPTSTFIPKHLQNDYDPSVCPVTGGDCP
ncbi:amidophosphoribosyltransferase [Nocardia nova]|uniref:Amidophosphoribosyltransferase n=1 Tax=Nocardia nova TaxID=37330 RepID=A0A2S6AMC5_9NOCA|nr:phosphoribosyltransferase [Nocardia nova]PPJ36384.1 amidophosphoribosyltransferase [Nocardia nova]